MKPIKHLWSAFSNVGVRRQWRKWLRDEYEYWAEYLTATGIASSYPCDNSKIDCLRKVLGTVNPKKPDAPFYKAVCNRLYQPQEYAPQPLCCCPNLILPEDEVRLLRMDAVRFLDTLCKATNITRCNPRQITKHTYHIGEAQSTIAQMIPVYISFLAPVDEMFYEVRFFSNKAKGPFYWLIQSQDLFDLAGLSFHKSTQHDAVVVPIEQLIGLKDPPDHSALTTREGTKGSKSKKQLLQVIQPLQKFPSVGDMAEQYADRLSKIAVTKYDANATTVGLKVLRGGKKGREERTHDEYKTKSYYLEFKKIDDDPKYKNLSRTEKFRKAAKQTQNPTTLKPISYKTIERAVKKWEKEQSQKEEKKKGMDRRM